MAWNRPAITPLAEPRPPVMRRWINTLLFLIFGCFSGRMFFPTGIPLPGLPLTLNTNWSLIAISLVLLWILAFGFRFYFYGNRLDCYQQWKEECSKADEAWRLWASRYMAVVKSVVLLPDQITASMIYQVESDIEVSRGMVKHIDYVPKALTPRLSLLLSLVANEIMALPEESSLNITLIVNELPINEEVVGNAFAQGWQQHIGSQHSWRELTIVDNLSPIVIEDWIKSPASEATLLLVAQHSDMNEFSDGLAVMLLINDDHAQRWGFGDQTKIYRPMIIDRDQMALQYQQFINTQPPARAAKGLLLADSEGSPYAADILQQSLDDKGNLDVSHVRHLENMIGTSGPTGAWLALALAADLTSTYQDNYIVLAQDAGEWTVSAIQPALEHH
ncbi:MULTISPECIES: hypothetical protein [unclassified Brenneria]|uniref:hypothetical protein n=1 Tax=unclassified Brenneria TaxID=2634434 RepID=UPI0029C5AC9A|nr:MULTISPECIES: hypothetical protein [unclassified Brenneria]MDX5631045.1 hypothetical protein [Brenneria sp. L3-3Z]MDX5698119.1 hypothetical protein [Brenneria sp. L4-2C]